MPASAAALVISSTVMAAAERDSMMYLARNSSPCVRAIWIFSTCCLLFSRVACNCRNCELRRDCSLRRSSAEPPKGLKAIAATTRLASSRRPMRARMATRGSVMDSRFHGIFGATASLELLSIRHIQGQAVQRFGLRGRRDDLPFHRAELGIVLEGLQRAHRRAVAFRSHDHIQGHVSLIVNRGADANELHVVRNGLLQVAKDLVPTDPFAPQQGVDEDAALQHRLVLRLVDPRIEFGLLVCDGFHLLFEHRHLMADIAHLLVILPGQVDQHSQGRHQQHGHYARGHDHRPVAPERLARQIYRYLHISCSWPPSANTPAVPRCVRPALPAAIAPAPFPRPAPPGTAVAPRRRARRNRRAATFRRGRPGCLPYRRTWVPERR